MGNDFQGRLEAFLGSANKIERLTPDASTREYFRVDWGEKTAIACVYPEDDLGRTQFSACLDVTEVFLSANLPVAKIFASDNAKGIILHEDFGNTILRDVLMVSSDEERESLLHDAIFLIAKIQSATQKAFELNSISSKLKFDQEKLFWELNFFRTHFFESFLRSPLPGRDREALETEFRELAAELETYANVLTHRDFHAANLMLTNGELKIIDHQDARIGSVSYDLVSLLMDRVAVVPEPDWLYQKFEHFLEARKELGLEPLFREQFEPEFQLQTIQRCLKAIGTFSYQSSFRGKTHFITYIKPMFQIVLRASEKLDRFPNLRKIVRSQLLS